MDRLKKESWKSFETKLFHLWRWTTFPGMTGWKFWFNGLRPLREGKGVEDIQLAIVLTKVSPLRGSQSICALIFFLTMIMIIGIQP